MTPSLPENINDKETQLSAQSFEEMTLDELAKVLSLTIKYDDTNKLVVFLAMLSAFTDSSQINVSLNSQSSTGKSFIATEIAKLFPVEDKVERSGASPTAFFYEQGVFDEELKARIVSLERKILIFYEQPNSQLQEKLRALLSHDQRDLKYSFTNKDKGKNKADRVILRGFPSTIFCSAGLRLDEQETTRAVLLSPEVTDAKILAGMLSQAHRSANADEYKAWIESRPERITLKERIIAIRDEHVDEIIVPNHEDIDKRFREMFPIPKPRHMRDISHLVQLIKAISLLNVWHRRHEDGTILANESDVSQAFELWKGFSESQEFNVPPVVLQFYKEIIVPAYIQKFNGLNYSDQRTMICEEVGLTPQELNSYHIIATERPMNGEQVRKQILPQLESSGLIAQEKPKDDADKRTRHIFPKWFPDGNDPKTPNNIGKGGQDNTEGEGRVTQDILDLFR